MSIFLETKSIYYIIISFLFIYNKSMFGIIMLFWGDIMSIF